MIYYRVAWKNSPSSTWQWKSTQFTSLATVLTFIKAYGAMPRESLRIFLSSSGEAMDEMLARENQGLVSNSVRADELLRKTINIMEVRRLEMDLSTANDHDTPYVFALPLSTPQKLAWTHLMTQVHSGNLAS